MKTTKPAVDLDSLLTQLRADLQYSQQQFWYEGDATNNKVDFSLAQGWEPLHVFNNGSIQRPGSGEDYTVGYDGFVYTVTFATEPADGNDVLIVGVPTWNN